MKDQKAEQEKIRKDIEELREKLDVILLALEKGKTVADPTTSSNPVHDQQEIPPYPLGYDPPLRLVAEGFMQQNTTYNPLYDILVGQYPPPFVKGTQQIPTNIIFREPEQMMPPPTVLNLGGLLVKTDPVGQSTPSNEKFEVLEERLIAVEGTDVFGNIDASQLCLISGLVILLKFKVPEFEKYDGSSCPKNHLIMYCKNMAAYV
ncbi:uncharacterized protein LOC111017812 [Momordica charantia]|uniref:Uncharacterized protein LOC111017812 n=1 Tax=Momordica charantia TaxID=3673 RepID=A0A6J1D7T3_MOMCH|nr:uncharacterized protein LOC111017812 [Momordica charantia]